ncbi:unnamed protein product [Urochloa decumbens]|uniref:KIB1-4 beta-propeller domain-containing protein n=1 Tax=Urochloa decumbens TaxID=240449 RepID=A0ABC9DVB4_9POAL
MPLVALGDKAYLDIVNNAVHKLNLTIPCDANCGGSVDHLLFLRSGCGGCFLADPFSEVVSPVPDLAFFIKEETRQEMFSLCYTPILSIRKVVAHWPQGSSAEPVVAALITKRRNWCSSTIFVCRAGTDTGVGKESYHTMSTNLQRVLDIAFFRGNLYALYEDGELVAIEIGEGSYGNPVITNVKYTIEKSTAGSNNDFVDNNYEDDGEMVDDDDGEMVNFIAVEENLPIEDYLVESGDLLLKLNRWIINCKSGDTDSFDVYYADLDASPCQWKPARSLHGRALFLGQSSSNSKSIHVGDGHYVAQEDCIYFVRHAGDSGIYNVRSGKMIKPLVPDTKLLDQSCRPWIPTWIFPDPSIIHTHMERSMALRNSDFTLLFLADDA